MNADRTSRRRSTTVRRADLNRALATVETQMPRVRDAGDGRPVLVVLGMHRSGTSLLSHVLHYLGADMADESDPVSKSNPGGFWERPDIVALHDEVLEAIGRPVGTPLHSIPFPPGWWRDKKVQPIKARMLTLVEQKLAESSGWWGFKDPRTCRLLPLWSELFEALDVRPHYVWTIRAPGESSASMAAKNPHARPMSTQQAEVTWLAYNYDVLRYLLGTKPILVEYGDWFGDPLVIGRRLQQGLNLQGLSTEHDFVDCIRRIVNKEFRHQVEGRGEAISSIPLAQSLFFELAELSRSENPEINERLGRYVTILDIVFRAMQPFVQLLAEVPALRSGAREGEQRVAQLTAEREDLRARLEIGEIEFGALVAQRDLRAVEFADRLQTVTAEKETLGTELLTQQRGFAELQLEKARAAALHDETQARLKAAVATERGRASRLELYAESLLSEHTANRETAERHIAELETALEETRGLVAQAGRDKEDLSARLQQTGHDKEDLMARLATSEARCRELQIACDGYLARIAALKQRRKLWG